MPYLLSLGSLAFASLVCFAFFACFDDKVCFYLPWLLALRACLLVLVSRAPCSAGRDSSLHAALWRLLYMPAACTFPCPEPPHHCPPQAANPASVHPSSSTLYCPASHNSCAKPARSAIKQARCALIHWYGRSTTKSNRNIVAKQLYSNSLVSLLQ